MSRKSNSTLKTLFSIITFPFSLIWKIYSLGCSGLLVLFFVLAILTTAWNGVYDHVMSIVSRDYNEAKMHLSTANTLAGEVLSAAAQKNADHICGMHVASINRVDCTRQLQDLLTQHSAIFRPYKEIRVMGYGFSEDMKTAEVAYFAPYLENYPFDGIYFDIVFEQENDAWKIAQIWWYASEETQLSDP
jgi:hypothetical protein